MGNTDPSELSLFDNTRDELLIAKCCLEDLASWSSHLESEAFVDFFFLIQVPPERTYRIHRKVILKLDQLIWMGCESM